MENDAPAPEKRSEEAPALPDTRKRRDPADYIREQRARSEYLREHKERMMSWRGVQKGYMP